MVAVIPMTGTPEHTHAWLRSLHAAIVPGHDHPLLRRVMEGIGRSLTRLGHAVSDAPDAATDLVLTTYRYGQSLGWRQALMFTMRRRYGLDHTPMLYTLVLMARHEFDELMARIDSALVRDPIDPGDFQFPDLAPQAWQVLVEQGQRGGPILTLERILQAQAKCIRLLLLIGEEEPEVLYHFDLVGAHPTSDPAQGEAFYDDIALRMVTSASTSEVTDHEVIGPPISQEQWARATTPDAMKRAGVELGDRGFFTSMIRVDDLIHIPAVSDVISTQYSEGCFATWDPQLDALVATITGSARPVEKDHLTDDELAVITAARPDGLGAEVRHVEGLRNDPPSSEAVELIDMDTPLPRIRLTEDEWGSDAEVPVARSKLHGHRGVRAYDPRLVEHVHLDLPYYHYPVSCSTDAQARAIRAAFSRAEALNNPADPRQVVFTVIPGHGIVIVEKWVPGKQPLQVIWEFMDAGALEIDNLVPQGVLEYAEEDGKMVLRAEE
jgi:hypothetical protein